ncbi:hypothetical protein BMR07_16580 [Methylococcaceae bacterium CS1]|nr:hypothetical protein BMR07_16580 [Methylococcaceae bacterium CS1]
MIKPLSNIILNFILSVFWLWCSVAIYFILLPYVDWAVFISVAFVCVIPLIFFLLPQRKLALLLIVLAYIAVLFGWNNMQPSNDRIWMPSVAKNPYAITQGNQVSVHNIRNFDYQTEHDFIQNYYDKTYNLDELETLSFILSYWDGGTKVAHTILSFGFKNGDYLAVSAETRLELGEPQELIQGFFNQYEMLYVLADERDVIRLRTNLRKEEVFLYPTRVSKENVRKVFDVIMTRVNKLHQQPEFYNTLTQNCFTALRADLSTIAPPKNLWDWRVLANGYADQMLYESKDIDTDLSFIEAKQYFHINQYVSADNSPENFSQKIRPNLYRQ